MISGIIQTHFIYIFVQNVCQQFYQYFHYQWFRPLPEPLMMENIDSIEISTKFCMSKYSILYDTEDTDLSRAV